VTDDLPPEPEWAALMQQLADATTDAERQAIRAQLDVITERRAAEADAEWRSLVEAFGGDPIIGTRVVDGGTIHNPPGHFDLNSAFVQMPDGSLIDKDELMARTHPPRPPDGPPAA
jgi:hypothetical protein